MKPGIWVHRIHRPNDPHVKDITEEHPDWFVRKPDGSLVSHRGFYMLDTTNEEAVENMVRKLYRGLHEQGWDYVKIDGTGDLLPVFGMKEPVPARTVIRPAICAMAGGVLMLSDKAEVYQDDRNIEGMKRMFGDNWSSSLATISIPDQEFDWDAEVVSDLGGDLPSLAVSTR